MAVEIVLFRVVGVLVNEGDIGIMCCGAVGTEWEDNAVARRWWSSTE